MSSTLIDARGLARRFGDHTLFTTFDLRVTAGERVALVGENGTGKSTLLRLLAGRDVPDDGHVERHGTLAYLPQLGRARRERTTVREVALEALGVAGPTRILALAERWLGGDVADRAAIGACLARKRQRGEPVWFSSTDPIEAHADALQAWLDIGGDHADADLAAGATRIGLARELLDRPLTALSSGQGVRAALLPLAARPHDALLLDEPTNHLDGAGRALLDDLVSDHAGALVVASHDRRFLAAHADRIVALDPRGGAPRVYSGGWDAYERERAAAAAGAQSAWEQAIVKRDELVAAEREIRRRAAATRGKLGHTARDGDKHVKEWFSMRLDGVEARGATVGARAARIEIPDKPWQERPLALVLTPDEIRSPYVVALEAATVQRGAWTSPTFEIQIAAGERVLLRGANGSGKSTLLGALGGTLPLASGVLRSGPQAVVSVLGAVEEQLGSDAILVDAVRALTGLDGADARGRLAHLGLGAELADRRANTLSPGERTRAELAVLGARRTTCLLLDEPSNHLDLRALEALEAALDGWPGALVVATHDDAFAERLRPTREIRL